MNTQMKPQLEALPSRPPIVVDTAGRRQLQIMTGAVAMALVIGALDYVTGSEASVAALYLVPIAVATWFVGLRAGLLLCGLSAVVRLQDLWINSRQFANPLTGYWNGMVELALFVVVAVILSRLRITSERRAALTSTDPMTGAHSRAAFIDLATRELARAERYNRSLSLAYLDVDHLAAVNDESGTAVGDRLLMRIAETLKGSLRAFDLVARHGGDEFVILLPETDTPAADAVLDHVMRALRAAVLGHWPVTFSVGAVTIDGPRTSLDRLLQQADNLVLTAKQAGGDRCEHRHLHRSGLAAGEFTVSLDDARTPLPLSQPAQFPAKPLPLIHFPSHFPSAVPRARGR